SPPFARKTERNPVCDAAADRDVVVRKVRERRGHERERSHRASFETDWNPQRRAEPKLEQYPRAIGWIDGDVIPDVVFPIGSSKRLGGFCPLRNQLWFDRAPARS